MFPSRIIFKLNFNFSSLFLLLLLLSFIVPAGQGHGIILSDNEDDILEKVKRQKTKYVVQKYVECPMLVHDIKFDLRQYFLIMIDDTHLKYIYTTFLLLFLR